MKNRRISSRTLGLILVVAMLAGCVQVGAAEEYDYSHFLTEDGRTIIRAALGADPGTFDPAQFGAILGLDPTTIMLREKLYEPDQYGNLIGQIAKNYTVDDDNLTYHVEIYDYVYDSAGNHLTAEDVAFCFMRAKENGFNSTSYYDSVTADDDYNVTIKLNNTATGIFMQVCNVVALYTRAAYEAGEFGTADNCVFTGPYALTEWVGGSSLRFEKREDYWQKDELRNYYAIANVDVIDYLIIQEAAQLSIALETNRVDMVYNLSAMETERFREGGDASEGFHVYEFMNRQSQLMYLNQSGVLGESLDLRKAVMHSIDIDGVIFGVLDGNGVACHTFGNATISDYNPAWEEEGYFKYDPDYAKECLAAAGYAPSELTLRIMTDNSELRGGIALMLQAYLMEIGINVELLSYENALFNTYKYDETQFDIMLEQTSWNGPTVTTWRDKFDMRNFENGKNGFIFASDDEMQDLLVVALDIGSYSAEGVDAFHNYVKDNYYARGLMNQISYSVTRDCVVEYVNYRPGTLFPARCTYVWNEQ